MLDKTFRPAEVEGRIYAQWEDSGAFRAGRRPDAEPFCIVIPPPNVTGPAAYRPRPQQHAAGRALAASSACGARTCCGSRAWIMPASPPSSWSSANWPSASRAVSSWAARNSSSWCGSGRTNPAAPSPSSCAGWARPATGAASASPWTRDCRSAVLKVFVELHKQGLIYKDKRLVNWDPRLQTAVSDLEVESIEMKGHLWHLKYPIENEPGRFIIVATTRPETMLGDTAVAVHPDDERYKALIGKHVRLPLTDRLIPIIADEHSDPEKGSGAVKITPAHDFNDFEVGKRHSSRVHQHPQQGCDAERQRARALSRARSFQGARGHSRPISKRWTWSTRSSRSPMPCRMTRRPRRSCSNPISPSNGT